jgi:hypothetical protein
MLTANTVSIYAGSQLKPPTSTDTSPSGLLSQPLAHLSEYLRSERGLTQLLTHSLLTHSLSHSLPTLAAAVSHTAAATDPAPRHRRSWASPARRRLSRHRQTVNPLFNLQFLDRRRACSPPLHGEQLRGAEP